MDVPVIQIREARPADTAILAQSIVDYGTEHGRKLDPRIVADDVATLLERCTQSLDHTVLLAEGPDGLLGYTVVHWAPFFLFHGIEGYISELFVAKSGRGSGIGSQLLSRVESEARDRGCFRLMLNNLKDADSYKRRFYGERGFTERTGVGNFVKGLETS